MFQKTVLTFAIPGRGSLRFQASDRRLGVRLQSDADLDLRLEFRVFITQQLVPFWCLESNNKTP